MTALAEPRARSGFAVQRRDLSTRTDVNYARLAPTVADFKARSRYDLVPLGSVAPIVQYGDSSRSVEEDTGTPILRMNNLQDGDWDLTDLKYTMLDDTGLAPYLLAKDDILFNRTNSKELVGKCGVFRESGGWIFASYLIRVRVDDPDEMSPEFLARFLNSHVGRVQIDRLSRQIIGMANINAQEIRSLLVPKPPPHVQAAHVKDLAQHWGDRQSKQATVTALLSAGSREIGDRLSLHPPMPEPAIAHAATRATMVATGRVNPEFFHPERILAVRAIHDSPTPSRRLDEAADFVRDFVPAAQAADFYVGLAHVERDTGELVSAVEDDLPTGQCVRFQPGDVLYAKLRPYLNKVHLAERAGVASPEFMVLRPKEGTRAEYIAAILRSEIVLAQTRHMTSGNTHPRLTGSDVHQMHIPVPDDDRVQDAIADLEAESRTRARQLKSEAEAAWTDAKQRFGDDLLT